MRNILDIQIEMKPLVLFFLALFPVIVHCQSSDTDVATSWSEVIKDKKGTVVFYYYPSKPFIYLENEKILGIEYDLANSFVEFLEKEYQVTLETKWIVANQFDDVIFKLKDFDSGMFGVSSLSITDERAELVNFTPPYIPDISVLISSSNIPIAQTKDEFYQNIDGLTAISVRSSTLETNLIDLQNKNPINYDIVRVDNAGDIIGTIETMENGFGYIDLPTFLAAMAEGTSLKRQFFYPIKREGFGLTYPKRSDWQEPVDDYFTSEKFENDRRQIVAKYLGEDVTELIKTISNSAEFGPYEEIVILTKEKELQYKELLDASIRAQQDQRLRNVLIGGVVVFLFISVLFYSRYNLKTKANIALADSQQQLADLNEEKYNLIKVIDYDLRVSLTKISGLSRLYILENDPLTEDQQKIIEHILHTSDQLGGVIGNILDIDSSQAEQLNLKFEKVNLKSILEHVVTDFENQAKENGVILQSVVDDSYSYVKGDSASLRLVLENLLSNAVNFSKEGNIVTLTIQDTDEKIIVSVSDEGPGLGEEDRINIFEKSSDGMGLSIVKMYADLMKGAITCESELGKGTTFTLSLDKA
ncbi:MAG: transporter substrate-binding domain-containing protein [Cytophagales bacterium]|nr:transporter substrate-binding domain-containing protein [Cytophagales bacterium]